MPSLRTSPRSRGRFAAVLSAALVALMLAGVAGAGVIQQRTGALDGPSPASGHAAVIAHGVAPMPADQVAWRLVEDTAEAVEDAEYQDRALGFVLATGDVVVVNSATFGTVKRLAAGEAAFVPDGAFELRNSATDGAVPYARIALVPAEAATDGGGDTLLYSGDPFDAPTLAEGDLGFDLDLVRDVLADGEETELPDTGYPTLISVTDGVVEIDNVAQNPIELQTGEALAIPGNAEITADGDATFVAALIGPAVPIPPDPPRTTGTIAITTSFCQADTTAENFTPDACEGAPVEGGLELILADDSTQAADDSQADEGVYTWEGLAFGSYALAELDPQESYEVFVLLDGDGNELDPATLTISPEAPDLAATLYLLPAEQGTGSISLATYVCPEGMTPESMVGDACDLALSDFDWSVTSLDAGIDLSLDDATGDGQPFYTWSDLPLGDYLISPALVPEGYGPSVIPGTAEAPQGVPLVSLTADQPDAELLAYLFVQPEQPGGTGSLTATFYVCPEGTLPSNYDPNQCELASGLDYGFEPTTFDGAGNPISYTLDDAQTSDATSTWSEIPLATYQLYPTPPDGYGLTHIPNADGGDNVTGPYVVNLTEDAPDREIDVYFFFPSGNTGSVALVGYECPAPESSDEECLASTQVYVEAALLDAEGNELARTSHGNNLVWGEAEGLAVGTYILVLDLSSVPAELTLNRMVAAYDDGDGDDSTWAVDVTEAVPNVLAFALFV